jgi:hypothetical protein
LIVTFLPPVVLPCDGVTDVIETVLPGGMTLTFADFVSEQPAEVVTVTCSVSVPGAPAVNVMLDVPVPAVIVPLVIDQLYVAPAPAFATDALLPVEPATTLDGAVIVAFGFGLIVTVVVAEEALLQLPLVTTTV